MEWDPGAIRGPGGGGRQLKPWLCAIPGTSPRTNSKKMGKYMDELMNMHSVVFFLQGIFLFILAGHNLSTRGVHKIIQVYLTSQSLGNLGSLRVTFYWGISLLHVAPQQRHAFKSHASCMPWGPHDCGFMVMVEV